MDKKLRLLNHFPNLWWGIAIGLLALLLNAGVPVQAQEQPPQENKAVIYMFWGDGCPHCAEAKPYLEGLAQRYPWVELRFYEVWYDEDNRVLFEKMAAAYGFEARYVPTIFIGTQHWVGYNKSINPDIEKVIMECRCLLYTSPSPRDS